MALTDILIPVTAKKIGPSTAQPLTRPRVFYVLSSELLRVENDSDANGAVLKIKGGRKVELYESPNEFIAAQAIAQGATANIYAAYNVASAQTATGATVGAALPITKYFTEVSAGNGLGVVLPDPFVRRIAVIQNTTTGSITVWARGTTSPIDGSTAGYVLAAGKRRHFVAPTASTAGTTAGWKSAIDA